jgi:hypothetical protein
LFRDIGEALFGRECSPLKELAYALNVNSRNLRRWEAGTLEPPASIYADLLSLIEERRRVLDDLALRIEEGEGDEGTE